MQHILKTTNFIASKSKGRAGGLLWQGWGGGEWNNQVKTEIPVTTDDEVVLCHWALLWWLHFPEHPVANSITSQRPCYPGKKNLSLAILAFVDEEIRVAFACPFCAVLMNIFVKLVLSKLSSFLM